MRVFFKDLFAGSCFYKPASFAYWTLVNCKRSAYRWFCYIKFALGFRLVTRFVAQHQVRFFATSPKNFWHLSISSQYEDIVLEKLLSLSLDLRPKPTFLDIGANTGLYSCLFAKAIPNSLTYAFEPEKASRDALSVNLQLNGISNVIVVPDAVSNVVGSCEFFVRLDKDTHSIFSRTNAPSLIGEHVINIKTLTLDSFFDEHSISSPLIIKLDVEGAELLALEGLSSCPKGSTFIFVEIHDGPLLLQGFQRPKEAVLNRLRALGFGNFQELDDCHVFASNVGFS